MPPVRKPQPSGLKTHDNAYSGEQVRASSVVFGLVVIAALIVASAAWMGGSMSVVERRAGGVMDAGARMLGLSVEQVRVVGLEHAPDIEQSVRAAVMVEPGENMFRADPHKVRQRVEAAGRVVNVRVHRLWPDTLLVMADPARPVALWYGPEGWRTVDGAGRPGADLLTTASPELAALLRIEGEAAAQALPELLAALDAAPSVASRMTSAVRISGRRWSLRLGSGVVVRLPDDARMAETLVALEEMQGRTDFLNGTFRVVDARAAVQGDREGGSKPQFFLMPRAARTAEKATAGPALMGEG